MPNPDKHTDWRSELVKIGFPKSPLNDLYAYLFRTPFRVLLTVFVAVYLALNLLFTGAYLACGDCIRNAGSGSFADAFFFSIETFSTIGFGDMYPATTAGRTIVAIETITGLITIAVLTGILFSKFSRPTSRVLFSRCVVITTHDGVPSLIFRIMNIRGNDIVEAGVSVVISKLDTLAEGGTFRHMHDLKLRRSSSPLFQLGWTIIHTIDETSPLWGETAETLKAKDASMNVSLTGIDETFSQTIHAFHEYSDDEFLWGRSFADIITTLPDGRTQLDITKFHETVEG